jgi:hypothetical protein
VFVPLDEALCLRAWHVVLPSIRIAAGNGTIQREAGTVVVLEPWGGAVLFSARVDETHPEAELYDEFALAKALLTREANMPSRVVRQEAPHLLKPGHIKWGGAVVRDRLVVAFSGVEEAFDESISWSMLAWIQALCRNDVVRPGGLMDLGGGFVPRVTD